MAKQLRYQIGSKVEVIDFDCMYYGLKGQITDLTKTQEIKLGHDKPQKITKIQVKFDGTGETGEFIDDFKKLEDQIKLI